MMSDAEKEVSRHFPSCTRLCSQFRVKPYRKLAASLWERHAQAKNVDVPTAN